MINVNEEFDFLYTVFCGSPTKGLAAFENLLLPENDRGLNEDVIIRFTKLKDKNPMQQLLFDKVVIALTSIRKAVLGSEEARQIVEQRIDIIREIIAMDMVIAEDKLKLDNIKF